MIYGTTHLQVISKVISLGRTKVGVKAFCIRKFSNIHVKLHGIYAPTVNHQGLTTQHLDGNRFNVIVDVVFPAG